MSEREKGVTMVDVLIGTAIVAIIIALVYPGFFVAKNTIATSGRRDLIERAGDQLMAKVVREVRAGLVTAIADSPNPPSVSTVRPRKGVALDELDDGAVPWDGATRTLRFRQTGTLREADEKDDVNKDGDKTDDFATGLLELVEDGEARPLLTRAEVILGLPGYDGDVDGDGNDDPMFERVDRTVTIRIFLVHKDDQGRILTTALRSSVHLRNHQE